MASFLPIQDTATRMRQKKIIKIINRLLHSFRYKHAIYHCTPVLWSSRQTLTLMIVLYKDKFRGEFHWVFVSCDFIQWCIGMENWKFFFSCFFFYNWAIFFPWFPEFRQGFYYIIIHMTRVLCTKIWLLCISFSNFCIVLFRNIHNIKWIYCLHYGVMWWMLLNGDCTKFSLYWCEKNKLAL